MKLPLVALAGAFFAAPILARDVPDNLRDFYDDVRKRKQCDNKLATGFWSSDEDNSGFFLTEALEPLGSPATGC